MLAYISKRPKVAALGGGLLGLSFICALGAPDAQTQSQSAFPTGFPVEMSQELTADAVADPDPDGQTSLMTSAEAAVVSASPSGRTPLEICRARRTVMLDYMQTWSRMTRAQQDALSSTAKAWGNDAADVCASKFDEVHGYRIADQKQKIRAAEAELRNAVVSSIQSQYAETPQRRVVSSSGDCQWWRDEIERDDRQAATATTRDLRDGWEHNRLQAQNAYRDLCQ